MFSNKSGLLLVELIVAVGIFSVVFLALMKTIDISLISANVISSIIGEQDLKSAVSRSLSDFHCKKNLRTIGSINELKVFNEADPIKNEGSILLKTGEDFQNILHIVDMDFIDDPNNPTANTKEFTVYFKKKKVKHLNTRKNRECSQTNKIGCYKYACFINYEVLGTNVVSCDLLNCANIKPKPPKENFIKGILLSKSCDRHYGWDIQNEKCVFTGQCSWSGKSGRDSNGSWKEFKIGSDANPPLLKVHNSPSSSDCTSPGLPYATTNKKCVNDTMNECDKIPYRFRCDRHYGWDIQNEKCVFTGQCSWSGKSGRDSNGSWKEFKIGSDANPPLLKVHNSPSSSDCTSPGLPYATTNKKCVNDTMNECDN